MEPTAYDLAEDVAGNPVCVCCPRALHGEDAAGGRVVCRRCEAVMAGRIGEVVRLWPDVERADRRKGSRTGEGGRVSGPGGSAAPCNLTVLNLVSGDVVRRLERHEDQWRAALGWTARPPRGRPAAALGGVCRFLGDNLLWACSGHRDVWQLDDELRRLVGEMQAVVTGERRTVVTLPQTCPYTAPGWEDGDPAAPACGGTLRCDVGRALIRCTDCWTALPVDRWLELGITVGSIAINQEVA